MSALVSARPHAEPYHWWGLPWTPPNPQTLAELVERGTIGATAAQFLIWHVRSGGSVTVAAGPSGAGKSTLAYALSGEISPARTCAYIRGGYESFDWVGTAQSASTTILVNEISPHLPTYCWGEAARTVLQLAASGYQLLATLHADGLAELSALLQGPQIAASPAEVVALNIVVFLDSIAGPAGTERRVRSIVQLELDDMSGVIRARNLPV